MFGFPQIRNDGPRIFWFALIFFLAMSAWLMIRQTTPHGIGTSPDSSRYIKLAREITNNGLNFLGEDKAVTQPPGYPLVLAGASILTGQDPQEAAVAVNAVLLALIIMLLMLAVRRSSSVSPWLVGLMATFSLPLVTISAMAWSELLFIALVYSVLLLSTSDRQGTRSVILLGLLTAYAVLTRYLGLSLIPVVFLQLLLYSHESRPARIRISLVFLGAVVVVAGSFLLRNLLVSGTLFGPRAPSSMGLVENLDFAQLGILDWFLPEISGPSMARLALVAIGVGFIWLTRKSLRARISKTRRVSAVYTAFFLSFMTLLIISSTTTAYDGINTRLMAPVFPALIVMVVLVIAPGSRSGREIRLAAVARWALVFILVAQPVRIVIKDTHRRGREGAGGFNRPEWRDSQLLNDFLPELYLPGQALFTNAPGAVYLLTGIEAKISPEKNIYNSEESTGVTGDNLFEKYPGFDGSLLVLFERKKSENLFTQAELAGFCRLEPVATCPEGIIYEVGRLPSHDE